jgi:radical SAM protein (TIGR01212 family)
VLDLLADYQSQGHEVWLELGLQSAFDHTLGQVNRGHGFTDYRQAIRAARLRGLKVCTHLIVGMPGEGRGHAMTTLNRVLELGVEGLKIHPLHVVKGTTLAKQWSQGEYCPLSMEEYISIAADLIECTPADVIYHRVTGTASQDILLSPPWCNLKWAVLNGIEDELRLRGSRQGMSDIDAQLSSQYSDRERQRLSSIK